MQVTEGNVGRVLLLAREVDAAASMQATLRQQPDLDVRLAAAADEVWGETPHVLLLVGGDDATWSIETCRRLALDPHLAAVQIAVVAAGDAEALRRAGATWVATGEATAEVAASVAALARSAATAPFERAFARTPVGIALLDRALRYVRVNDALAAVNGLPAAAHRGRSPLEVVPDVNQLAALLAAGREVLATGRPRVGVRVSGRTPGAPGEERDWIVDLFPVDDREVALGVVVRDVTDERRAEAAALEALERERLARAEVEAYQERLAFVYSATGQLYSTPLDAPLRVQTLARLVVPSLADWCLVHARPRGGGGRWSAAAHWDPDRMAAAEGLAGRETPAWALRASQHGEPELVSDVTSDAVVDRRLVEALGLRSYAVVPLRAGRGPFGAVLFAFAESNRRYTDRDLELLQDLAQRAAIALENAELFHEAEVALRARDQLVSIASHDVRNPIGAAALRVAVLRAALDRGQLAPAKLGEGLVAIERGLHQAVALLNDLLNVTRIASNRLELKLEQVDLRDLAREVAERSRELLQAAGCSLSTVPAGPPVVGWWDRMRLEQVLANLLSNAMKYGRGRPIAVGVEVQDGQALLSVQDQGVGIPPEEHERIFERFGRATDERRDDSHGLGLWIVKRVVSALGGRVWVTSRPGQGATFTVELPLAPQAGEGVELVG